VAGLFVFFFDKKKKVDATGHVLFFFFFFLKKEINLKPKQNKVTMITKRKNKKST